MYCYSKLSKMTRNGDPQQKELKNTNTRIQPQHGRQQHTRAAATAAAATAAADVVPAGRSRQRRRRGRRASVGVVEVVARLHTTGATSRRCLARRRSTAEDGRSDLVGASSASATPVTTRRRCSFTRRHWSARQRGVVVPQLTDDS